MIIDCNASAGTWPTRPPLEAGVGDVWRSLHTHGVERAFIAHLASAWCRNPHLPNRQLLTDAAGHPEVSPVPTLDPTVHTWRDHLALLSRAGSVRMVRLLPAYGPYDLEEADEMLDELRRVGLAVQVQTRLEDPRLHHPRARVPDLPAAEVVKMARRHHTLTVFIGGARFAELRALRDEILDLKLCYADTSQCDGMDSIRVLCEEGLRDRLVYGSHVPLFEVAAGLRRVLDGLDDETAGLTLGGHATRAL
ncbi:MAG: hypothetical protein HYU66_28325 [Armatimonadetes bacterium]|nr:hypothetical protein [Armatimonadota bacterium]